MESKYTNSFFEYKRHTTTLGITDHQDTMEFSVPIIIYGIHDINLFYELSKELKVPNPLCGNDPEYRILYLKCTKLTLKQKEELYNKGKQHISIFIKPTYVSTTETGLRCLKFQIKELYKVDNKDLGREWYYDCPQDQPNDD